MSWDRRHFLMGGSAIASGALIHAGEAQAAPVASARSVTEFGVRPDSTADQTAALQKAIDQISAAGEFVHMPGGKYLTGALKLPARCAIAGVPGRTQFVGKGGQPILDASGNQALTLSGLMFDGAADPLAPRRDIALIVIKGGDADISHCLLERCGGGGIAADGIGGAIRAVNMREANGPAILVSKARSISVSQCTVRGGDASGIDLATSESEQGGAIVTGNHIVKCATGISLKGSGAVSGNVVAGSSAFGLRLGGGYDSGVISATGNTIGDCTIAIGVVAGGETILASINLISKPADAAIRAFSGSKLVGPDLARESAEAYLNLTVAGNVVR
ncbi:MULTISPECIES: TIGR03808 family TAT-translocated repetitive protein [Rhodomicrobium]|uniref:TIGR03808 family TAT-translocated repetitive protein n=1 Tax=Rhodomicrobium TaxID=1068 RepID=UPI000B4B84B9|nr:MULTISPECIES: TIGR03808 family TAT-translocated repetitive protein [Rhodomicrobium]